MDRLQANAINVGIGTSENARQSYPGLLVGMIGAFPKNHPQKGFPPKQVGRDVRR